MGKGNESGRDGTVWLCHGLSPGKSASEPPVGGERV